MSASYEDTKKREKREKLRGWFFSRKRVRGMRPEGWEIADKEWLWGRLEQSGYVDLVLNEEGYTREDLLDEATELLLSKMRKALSTEIIRRPDLVGGEEDEDRRRQDERSVDQRSSKDAADQRAVAYTWYLLKLAAEDRRVRQFRQRVLNGTTVSYDEAVALVDSPAAAVFSCNWFEKRGIPFADHKAQLLEGEWPSSEESAPAQGTIKIEWHGGELLAPFEGVAPFRTQAVWLDNNETAYSRPGLVVLEDSVLGALFQLAQHLSERFPWWGDRWMPMFVLMGRAPVIGHHETHFYQGSGTRYGQDGKEIPQPRQYTPITIEVPPWYSVEMVSQIYRGIKEDLPTTPLPSERRLALFEFVMKQPGVKVLNEGRIPKVPWVKFMRSWNESLLAQEKGWRYKHRGNFRRDFQKAFEQIVNYYR